MLRLDDRAGSRELYSALLATGVKVEFARLPYGDVEFDGHGPDECPVLIGIEHKKVPDVLKCMQDGRFSGHQLPGLVARYWQTWLIVEGSIRGSPSGQMQVESSGRWYDACAGHRGVRLVDYLSWLTGIEVCGGIHVKQTTRQAESAWLINSIANWFAKPWSAHRSHTGFDLSDRPGVVQLIKPGIVRRVAKELPGIGWGRSGAVEAVFGSVVDMVSATEQEWSGIDGIGRTMARKIMKELGSDKLWS